MHEREAKKQPPTWLYVGPVVITMALMRSGAQSHGAIEGAIVGGIVGGAVGLISYGIWRAWLRFKQSPATKRNQFEIDDAIPHAALKKTEQPDIDDAIRQVRLEAHVPQSEPHSDRVSAPEAKQSNFIVKHWRGELPLPVSYWVMVVFLTFVVTYIYEIAGKGVAETDFGPLGIGLTEVAFVTPLLAITAWQLVGTWRSAGNYMKSSKTPFWGGLARFVVLMACIRAAVEFYTVSGPMLSQAVNMALIR